MQIVGARPSVLRGELANKNCRKEPVCLKCSKGLVNKNCRKEPIYLSNWALGAVALVAFKPCSDLA